MALNSYSALRASIADWLNRDDLTSVIPDFISLAEAQLERRLPTQKMVKRADATIDTPFSALPSDFLSAKSLVLTSTAPVQQLVFLTEDELDSKKTLYRTTGKPMYFALVGNQIEVLPPPDTGYTAELTYVATLAKLSDSNASNWILERHPDVYLYGSLLQAAPYLRDDERVGLWTPLYAQAIEDMILQNERAAFSQGRISMTVKPTRVIP
jgi:hypothetical protein